ncbi:9783_t:CDS:1, partial [Dentiscutata heterogama]
NPKLSVTGHDVVPISDSKFLILFGTETETPLKFTDPVQQVDIQTGVVDTLNISGSVSTRYAHTATVVDNKVYVLGGISNSNILGDVMYLDLSSYSWNTINNTSQIAGHSTLAIGKYLISCFGFDSNLNLRNDCNVFDTSTNVYVPSNISGTIPAPRSYSSMVSADDNDKIIYVFGGFDKDSHGYNDLYILDASNTPDLSWSSVSISAKVDKSLIPSPRGAHSAFVKSGLMTIWGGYSNTTNITIADGNLYFFDIKANMWVNSQSLNDSSMTSQSNEKRSNALIWDIIIGVACIIILIIFLLGFFMIRRRRLKKNLQDKCETYDDPYFRPGGQLGSESDLLSNAGTLQKPSPPTPSFIRPRSKYENDSISLERRNSTSSVVSTSMSMSSDSLKKTNPLTFPVTHITEPQRMKRSHRRTSSVTLSTVDVENITHQTHQRLINNNFRCSSQSYSLRRSVLSNTIESYSLIDNNHDISRGSSVKSVNSLKWVGFNDSITDVQNGRKLSLHVRNDFNQKSKNIRESDLQDEYIIHGDYIDTTNKSSAGQYHNGRNSVSVIPKQEGISEEEEFSERYDSNTAYMIQNGNYESSSERTSKESESIDKFSYHSISSQSSIYSCDSEDKRKVRKSKRSSKRTSKVSFAPTDEKIEFDESESSKSVYLARMSARSSQSSTSSN